MKILLIPLDERPVNTKYPLLLGDIAGVEILLPPPAIQGRARTPADRPALDAWIREISSTVDTAIVSCDYFAYGNLINARISDDSAARVITRLTMLEDLSEHCDIHAFTLITRVPNADDNIEEPLYWGQWGIRLHAFSRITDQRDHDSQPLTESESHSLANLEASIPPEIRADWLRRRLRNHTVTLALLDMASRGTLASLLITSDDTSTFGFSSRERDRIKNWAELIGEPAESRLLMHPGADEVGAALLAKVVNESRGAKPRVYIDYAIPGDESIVAPYEDRPVRETVHGQIEACGCQIAVSAEESDFILAVATPSPRRKDYRPEFLDDDRLTRTEPYRAFLNRLAKHQTAGRPVALADVAYPNGVDPLVMELLLDPVSELRPADLAAFGAWNTAGNTLGVVVAQAACALYIENNPKRAQAQQIFLTHRFLEDYAYQSIARRQIRDQAESTWSRRDPDPTNPAELKTVSEWAAERLTTELTRLQQAGIGHALRIRPGSVRLPWDRTFEIDFDLEIK